MNSRRIRKVLIADDHQVIRKMLAELVEEDPNLQLVGAACDGLEAVDLSKQLRPDVVVIDLSMPRLDGVEAIRQIRAELPESRIIGLSMHESDEMMQAARNAGASAYLNKCDATEDLLPTILA